MVHEFEVMGYMLSTITMPRIILSILVLFVFKFLYQIIYYKFFHPLRHYPGPFWAGVTRLAYAWHSLRGTSLDFEYKAVQKYGSIVRITPTMLMLADSTVIPTVYHRRDTKSRFYPAVLFDEPGLLLLRNPQHHSAQRRAFSAPYALSNIQKLEPLIEKHIVKWLDKMDTSFAQPRRPLDFSEWSTFLSYDTLTDLGFRNPLGFIESGSDVDGLIRQFRRGALIFGTASVLYTTLEFLVGTWARRFLMVRPGMTFGLGRVMSKASEVLKERTEAMARGETIRPQKGDRAYDFLQGMMDTRTPTGEYMSPERIQTELFVIMSAGTDGFSSAASGLMAHVMYNPEILARLLNEIKGASLAGSLTHPVPSYTEVAQHLPYFIACVRETLRLYPMGSALLPREITPSDPELVLGGLVVPVGTEVACNPWICGRDRALYGEDAEIFNPDRWLEDPERAKVYEKYNFAWGYGSRICLGKHFATVMLYKSLAAFFMKFKLSLCEVSPETPKASPRSNGMILLWENVLLNLEKLYHVHGNEELICK